MPAVLLITALEAEARALRATARAHNVALVCTGPGEASAAFLRTLGSPPNAVLLAGIAGGLDDHPPRRIARVIDERTSDSFTPTLAHDPRGAVLVTATTPACTVEAKRTLAQTHGAHLVDCEAAHIARACADLSIPWGVLRTVSDGPDHALPAHVTSWVDERGSTRTARVLLDLARRPALLPALLRLAGSTNQALRTLVPLVDNALDALD